jgi:hypothetical protein
MDVECAIRPDQPTTALPAGWNANLEDGRTLPIIITSGSGSLLHGAAML